VLFCVMPLETDAASTRSEQLCANITYVLGRSPEAGSHSFIGMICMNTGIHFHCGIICIPILIIHIRCQMYGICMLCYVYTYNDRHIGIHMNMCCDLGWTPIYVFPFRGELETIP
jgi:hypothetical protein